MDDLNVSYSDLVFQVNGKDAGMVSKELMDQNNCWSNLNEIKERTGFRFELLQQMKESDIETAKGLANAWLANEKELQKLWKFPKNDNYHKFWMLPHCECPNIDNNERHPHGSYVVYAHCPLHGESVPEQED